MELFNQIHVIIYSVDFLKRFVSSQQLGHAGFFCYARYLREPPGTVVEGYRLKNDTRANEFAKCKVQLTANCTLNFADGPVDRWRKKETAMEKAAGELVNHILV